MRSASNLPLRALRPGRRHQRRDRRRPRRAHQSSPPLGPRAARAVRHPDPARPPDDGGVRRSRRRWRKQPIGTGPFKFLAWDRGKRIRLGALPRRLAAGAAGSTRSCSTSSPTPCARSTARGAATSTCCRACSTLTTRSRSSRRPCTAAVDAVPPRARAAIRSWSSTIATIPLSDPQFRRALAMLWDRARFAHELHKELAHPDRRPAARRRHRRAAVRSAARHRAARGRRLPRQRRRRRARSRRAGRFASRCSRPAGNRSFGVEAHAFALELRKAGILRRRRARRRGDDPGAAQAAASSISRRWSGRGAPDEDPAPLYGAGGTFNFGGYRSTALEALLDERTRRRGRRRGAPILARIAHLLADDQPVHLPSTATTFPRWSRLGFTAWPPSATVSICAASGSRPDHAPAAADGRRCWLSRGGGRAGAGRRAACLPATPAAGPGSVDPFRPPAPEATELNARRKTLYRQGKWEEARAEVPRRRGRRPRVPRAAAQHRLLVRPPGAVRRGDRRGRGACSTRAYVPWSREVLEAADLGALKARPEMARRRRALRRDRGLGRRPRRRPCSSSARQRAPLRMPRGPDAAEPVFILNPHQEVYAFLPATGRFRQLTAEDGRVLAMVAAPDRRRIALRHRGEAGRGPDGRRPGAARGRDRRADAATMTPDRSMTRSRRDRRSRMVASATSRRAGRSATAAASNRWSAHRRTRASLLTTGAPTPVVRPTPTARRRSGAGAATASTVSAPGKHGRCVSASPPARRSGDARRGPAASAMTAATCGEGCPPDGCDASIGDMSTRRLWILPALLSPPGWPSARWRRRPPRSGRSGTRRPAGAVRSLSRECAIRRSPASSTAFRIPLIAHHNPARRHR